MAQISENRELKGVFDQLLDSDGFEVCMKPAKYYFDPQGEMDYLPAGEAVAAKQEILIGYIEEFVLNWQTD